MKNENSSLQEQKSIRSKIADKIDISDTALIKMDGNRGVVLENYKGILEYSDKRIRVKINPHTAEISGKGLEIRVITDELLYITGNISGVMFAED